MTDGERFLTWKRIELGACNVVLGPRSAVFAPVRNLGLIVMIDEDHHAYKQEQSPFYHARDVAIMRSRIEKCSVIFVSSTPSAEVWFSSEQKGLKRIFLEPDKMSEMQLIDLLNYNPKKTPLVSIPLPIDSKASRNRSCASGVSGMKFLP